MPTSNRRATSFRGLEVYMMALAEADVVFCLTTEFPRSERYALTDQLVRSSRAVSALIAEAWPRRRYPRAFANILNQAMGEACETQAWLDHAMQRSYLSRDRYVEMNAAWQRIGAMLYTMVMKADDFSGQYTHPLKNDSDGSI